MQRRNLWTYVTTICLTEAADNEQFQNFDKIFALNNIKKNEFAKDVCAWLSKKDMKINGFRIFGLPDTCKSLIANLLVNPFITCYMNNHGSENEFYLANMLNKSVILCEELYVTIATCEDLKSVLGGQNIDIAKKYDEKQLLSRTPVIITSNYALFGRGHLSPTDENALRIRCRNYQFNTQYTPTCRLTSNQLYLYLLNYVY